MMIPLLVLTIGSIIAGFIGANYFHFVSVDGNFFGSSIFVNEAREGLLEEIHHAPFLIKISPLLVGIIAIFLAYIFYLKNTHLPQRLASSCKRLYQLSYNKWYVDEIYEMVLVRPSKRIGEVLWKFIDVKIVDGIPNGTAAICKTISIKVSKLQTGYINNYAMWMVLGLVAILFF